MRQAIGRRLSQLTPEANQILDAAAVLGDHFTIDLLKLMSRFDVQTINNTLGQAVRQSMIRDDKDGYQFSHPLFRRTIYDELPLHRRQQLHLEAASTLETIHARHLAPFLAILASHYRLAGSLADPDKALEYAFRAAEAARNVLAFEEAATHYQYAIELLEKKQPLESTEQVRYCRLVLALADVQSLAGNPTFSPTGVHIPLNRAVR